MVTLYNVLKFYINQNVKSKFKWNSSASNTLKIEGVSISDV